MLKLPSLNKFGCNPFVICASATKLLELKIFSVCRLVKDDGMPELSSICLFFCFTSSMSWWSSVSCPARNYNCLKPTTPFLSVTCSASSCSLVLQGVVLACSPSVKCKDRLVAWRCVGNRWLLVSPSTKVAPYPPVCTDAFNFIGLKNFPSAPFRFLMLDSS